MNATHKMKLYPFQVCAISANERITRGYTIHQQFLCSACGAKQTMDVPNTLYTSGKCEECGHVTNIEADGCNYMLTVGGKL